MEKASHSSPLNNTNSKPSAAAATATAAANPNIVTDASSDGDTLDAGSNTTAAAAAAACSASSNSTSGSLSSLKSLNRASYKISKPLPKKPNPVQRAPPPQFPTPTVAEVAGGGGAPPQPPVYNIDKNDFRDVVQKLTGSPVHKQARPAAPSPAPAAPPAPAATSRLHRIRPPPLAQLVPHPPSVVPFPTPATMAPADPWTRPPLSPLPPLPIVSAAAESPISAYMRRLRSGLAPSPTAAAAPGLPTLSSPLGFGCLPSPRTAYQMMMSPGLVFPTSPGLPSPRLGEP